MENLELLKLEAEIGRLYVELDKATGFVNFAKEKIKENLKKIEDLKLMENKNAIKKN